MSRVRFYSSFLNPMLSCCTVPGCEIVSSSPAHVPTTSIRNSPNSQDNTGPRRISQTPVTMQNVRDYLATKAAGSAVQPASHNDSCMPELHVYVPLPAGPTSSSAATSLSTPPTTCTRKWANNLCNLILNIVLCFRMSLSPTELTKVRRLSVRKHSFNPAAEVASIKLPETIASDDEDSS